MKWFTFSQYHVGGLLLEHLVEDGSRGCRSGHDVIEGLKVLLGDVSLVHAEGEQGWSQVQECRLNQ